MNPSTAPSPSRLVSPYRPASISHERAPRQSPCVERPPAAPPMRRHGQIASQLHDSKYEPRICQSGRAMYHKAMPYAAQDDVGSEARGRREPSQLAAPPMGFSSILLGASIALTR